MKTTIVPNFDCLRRSERMISNDQPNNHRQQPEGARQASSSINAIEVKNGGYHNH